MTNNPLTPSKPARRSSSASTAPIGPPPIPFGPPPVSSPLSSPSTSGLLIPSTTMSSHAMRAPIRTLYSTEASDLEEQAFHRSFFLTDHLGWGPIKIEIALKKLVSYFGWFASKFDEHRYLIEAPNPQWLEATLTRGHVLLDNIQFRVSPWDPCYSEGLRMIPQWVRVRGFPAKFWQWEKFEKIFSDFGATVLEMDHATRIKRDRQVARLRLGMCDPLLLPSTHWVMHRDSGGYLSRFDLIFELEPAKNAGSGAWSKKGQTNDPVQGKPGAPAQAKNGTKGVIISEKSGSSQNTVRKNAPASGTDNKGKAIDPMAADAASDESDAEPGPDLTNGRAPSGPGGPSRGFWPPWIPSSYGPGSGRNPSSYAPYFGEECGPYEEIEAEPTPHKPSLATSSSYEQPPPAPMPTTSPNHTSPPPMHNPSPIDAPNSVPASPQPTSPATPGSEDECWRDADGTGLIPHVTVEHRPHGEVILHTPQGDFHCKTSEVLDTLTSQIPLSPTVGQQAAETLQAIHAVASLMTQLVTPLLHQPSPITATPTHMATATPAVTEILGSSRKRRSRPAGFPQPRRSVRIISQGGDTVPIMARATARVQSKYNLRSGNTGIPLLTSFPYTRMTADEVADLFNAYSIRLGCEDLDAPTIVTALKELSRQEFEQLLRQAFSVQKNKGSEHALIISKNAEGYLVVK